MRKLLTLFASLLVFPCVQAQVASHNPARTDISSVLGFEGAPSGNGRPQGWLGNAMADTKVVHGGAQSARIERSAGAVEPSSIISTHLPVDFIGTRLELRGYLRVADVTSKAALWMREDDAEGGNVNYDSTEWANFSGTADWKQFHVRLTLKDDATTVSLGALLTGTGRAWVDDLELLVDGQPLAKVAVTPRELTIMDRDHEFSHGSHIALTALTDRQVEDLASLAEVWGFLKFHHPAVTSGTRQWDFDLFRVMPSILSAKTDAERNARLLAWVDALGPVSPCTKCAQPAGAKAALQPDLAWLRDTQRWGPELSARLQSIYANRTAGEQFYVEFAQKGAANPYFIHESGYGSAPFPDSGIQLLSLFRWWANYEWWYPNRNLLPALHTTLRENIRPIALARDKHAYALELLKLVGEAHDSHANLWSSLDQRPPVGDCQVNAAVRFVGTQAVVWSVFDPASGLQRGDVLESIAGRSVGELVREWWPFYAASNDSARVRDIGQNMTGGPCGAVALRVRRAGQVVPIASVRTAINGTDAALYHDRPGDAFQLLSKDVAYLKLSSIKHEDVADYLTRAAGTKGWVIDVRNYPSDFAVFVLGQHFVEHSTPFARFSAGATDNPGAFHYMSDPKLEPQAPRYTGRLVVLVDEETQSQAEYTTMALRSAPSAIVIGSQTAGADGNVSTIALPYGMNTYMSGLGVFTPTGGQTQGIGLAIDVEAKPTVAGIAAGRDEVLEAALRRVLGDSVAQSEIERLAHR